MAFLIQIVIAIILSVIAYMLTPKPKQTQQATRDLESPTADAGSPIPYVWGTITMQSPNIIWYGEKDIHEYEVDA